MVSLVDVAAGGTALEMWPQVARPVQPAVGLETKVSKFLVSFLVKLQAFYKDINTALRIRKEHFSNSEPGSYFWYRTGVFKILELFLKILNTPVHSKP